MLLTEAEQQKADAALFATYPAQQAAIAATVPGASVADADEWRAEYWRKRHIELERIAWQAHC